MKRIVLFSLLLSATACLEKTDPTLEEENFFRIYDNADFTASFTPIDVQQTEDKGFLILAAKRLASGNFNGIYILKTDKTGALVNEVDDFDTNYVHPVGPLAFINGAYYFYCMDAVFQEAQLVKITANGDFDTVLPTGLSYPVAAAVSGTDRMMLLSYDNVNKEMVASEFNSNGNLTQGPIGFSIGAGDDTEEPIINHFIQGNKKFPFAIGSLGGSSFYINGFYEYTFSMVFSTWAGNTTGVVYGTQDDGGFSTALPLNGSTFAAARFNFGDNYLLPNVTLNTSGITIGSDLGGFALPELSDNTVVKVMRLAVGQTNSLLYAANTQSGQIALLSYREADGTFIGSRYLGFSNPFEVGSVTETVDEGLAVVGLTYVAGRFPRLCLFKFSKQEKEALLQ